MNFQTNKHTFIARILIGGIIFVECFVVLTGALYILITRQEGRVLGASISRIKKENVTMQPSAQLKHFYEWGNNQTITHERPWLPRKIEAKTNNDGIIGRDDYALIPPSDTLRIIAIGDSFTEGPFVGQDMTYPRQLESQLNGMQPCASVKKYEVLNMGVGGYDIEYAAAHMISKGLKYHPDLVLWFLKDDDFLERMEVNLERERKYNDLVNTSLGGDLTKFTPYQKFMVALGNLHGVEEVVHAIVVREQEDEQAHQQYFDEQERAVYAVAESTGAPIVMAAPVDLESIFKARLRLWSKNSTTLHFFDGIPALVSGAETFEPHDGHPNEAGYGKIAKSITAYLMETHLLCSDSPMKQ